MGYAKEILNMKRKRHTNVDEEMEKRWDEMGLDNYSKARVKFAKNKVRILLRHFGGHNNLSRSLGITPRQFLRIRRGEQHGSGAVWELIDTYYRIVFYAYIRPQGLKKELAEELLKFAPKVKHIPRRRKVQSMDQQPSV